MYSIAIIATEMTRILEYTYLNKHLLIFDRDTL